MYFIAIVRMREKSSGKIQEGSYTLSTSYVSPLNICGLFFLPPTTVKGYPITFKFSWPIPLIVFKNRSMFSANYANVC